MSLPIWSPRSTEEVAEFETAPAALDAAPLTGELIGRSFLSDAHVHARRRGAVGGGDRADLAGIGGADPRPGAGLAPLRPAAAVAGRLLLSGLLLGRPGATGVGVD